jgi:hypothetical protein
MSDYDSEEELLNLKKNNISVYISTVSGNTKVSGIRSSMLHKWLYNCFVFRLRKINNIYLMYWNREKYSSNSTILLPKGLI